jgi:hypothetical protein
MRRVIPLLVAISAATVLLAGCGGGGGTTVPSATATATGLRLETPPADLRTPSPALIAPRGVWLAAPAKPPADCKVDTGEAFQAQAGPGIAAGPLRMVGWANGTLAVNLSYPATKVLLYVDQSAGASVTIEGRERKTAAALLFYYDTVGQNGAITGHINVPADELGVSRLVLVGPFTFQQDAARGYFFAREPGCYDVTVRWGGGTATATIYVAAQPGS